MKTEISFQLNGRTTQVEVEPHARLLDLLRDVLGLTGTKEGCGEGQCSVCTVIVDGKAVNSCLFPALEAEGSAVTTIEGLLEPGGRLSPVQEAFLENGGAQCGFCTPGMIMTTVALLGENPDPGDDAIRLALAGNLCRCTGYVQIIDSIKAAARKLQRKATP